MLSITQLYKRISEKVDLPFLIFLITISSNKIYLKVAALLLIFALRPKFDLIFNKKIASFYPFMIILTTVQFLFFGHDFSSNHWLAFLVGIFYWFTCYAYMYQAYLFTSLNSLVKINTTLFTFTYLNLAVCLFNYFYVCIKAGTIWPFLQIGGDYGPSTGDYIYGMFGVPSYINAIVCSIMALYFIHQKKTGMFVIATFCAFLSFANIINMIFIIVLAVYFFFAGNNRKRVFIALSIILCFTMYIYISPDNYNYIRRTIGLSVNNEQEIMPDVVIAKRSEMSRYAKIPNRVKYVNDSSASHQRILMLDRSLFFNRSYDEYKTYYKVDIKSSPGKKIAVMQTLNFMRSNPVAAVFGAGVGNFSSRLAFQFSGRDSSRLFMRLPKYCSGYYFQNNLLIYDSMVQLPTEYHSIKHFPNNFFSQLLGEYGIIGLILFLLFYLYFFYKRCNNKLFFLMLLTTVACYLMLDYLFEFFNVMVIFELLLFIDGKQKQDNEPEPAA